MNLVEALRTAAEVYNPDDTTDLIGLALIFVVPASVAAIASIVGAVITVRGQRKGAVRWKGDRKMLTDVHKQTVNDHPEEENFREQVDRIEATQRLMCRQFGEIRDWQVEHGHDIRGLRQDLGAMRGDLRTDRGNLSDLETRINAFIRREHPGADPL